MARAFREQFAQFVVPSRDVEELAFTSGLIILDANVLLSVYRFAPESRNELLGVMERLRDRIWIPHQAGLEFYRNRVEVVADLRSSYGTLLSHVRKADEKLVGELSQRVNQLANRVLLRGEKAELLNLLESALSPLSLAIQGLIEKHELNVSYVEDPILQRLEQLLEGRVGEPFSDDFETERVEAQRRVDATEPPGFRDADKKGDAYGDYFVWSQALRRAKESNAPVLLFVTNDTKDDWYMHVHGQPVCAHPSLAEEALAKAGCQLVMMDTADFLKRSQDYIHADVSPETIREAETLPRQRSVAERIAVLQEQLKHAEYERHRADNDLAENHVMSTQLHHEEIALEAKINAVTSEGGEPVVELSKQLVELQQRRDLIAKRRQVTAHDAGRLQAQYRHVEESLRSAHAELVGLQRHGSELLKAEARLRTISEEYDEAQAAMDRLLEA